MLDWMKHKLESRLPGEISINNLRYVDDASLMAESEEELETLLMKLKEESAKTGLKVSIWKTKIMASGHITSWQIDGEKVEAVTDFIFLGSKITADRSDCSHEIKRCLLLGRKAVANPDSMLKSRDITLPTKVRIVKRMAFPVCLVTQFCPTLCNPIDCSPPGSCVHGILQVRILEGVSVSFSRVFL